MTIDFEREFSAFLHETTPSPPADLAPPTVATLEGDRDGRRTDFDATWPAAGARDDLRERRRRRPLLVAAAAAVVLGASTVAAVLAARPAHQPPAATPSTTVPRCIQWAEDVKESTNADATIGTIRLTYTNGDGVTCGTVLPIFDLVSSSGDARFAAPPGARDLTVIPASGHVTMVFRVRLGDTCLANAAPALLVMRSDFYGYEGLGHYTLPFACAAAPIGWTFTVSG